MPEQPTNSAGEVETLDQLQETPNTGGGLPDPDQDPVVDIDDRQLEDGDQ